MDRGRAASNPDLHGYRDVLISKVAAHFDVYWGSPGVNTHVKVARRGSCFWKLNGSEGQKFLA